MTRDDTVRSVHQRLLNVRDKTGEQFNTLLVRYGLERLLYRVEAAGHIDAFVLKGAMLFALWQDIPERSTRDIDFLGKGPMNHERLENIFKEACKAAVIDDGMAYDAASVQTGDIRSDQEYRGIRVRLRAFLGRARIPLQIDVGFGDTVFPPPELKRYPAVLDFPTPAIRTYHPATVVAEKLNAAVVLGMMNSRMKDFYDMFMILKNTEINHELLESAIRSTFKRRKVPIPETPAAFTAAFLEDGNKEKQWQAFLSRSTITERELTLGDVLLELRERLEPVLSRLRNAGNPGNGKKTVPD